MFTVRVRVSCLFQLWSSSSSSHMRVMSHNWSATKQRLHPQSVAEISRHSVLSGDRIRQCGTSSGSRHKDTDQCLSCHFLLFHAKTVQQRPVLPRKVVTRLPDCGVAHYRWELTTWADFHLCLHRLFMSAGCKSSHSGFLDVSRSNGGLRISGWIVQLLLMWCFR